MAKAPEIRLDLRATRILTLLAIGLAAVAGQAQAKVGPRCEGRAATITGTPGDDVIVIRAGRETVQAGAGDDLIRSLHRGATTVCGSSGDDRIVLGAGRDRVLGGTGADQLFAGGGRDRVDGGGGDDLVHGGEGNDLLTGGPGADLFRGGRGAGDTASFAGALQTGVSVELVAGTAEGEGGDKLTAVENVGGSKFADVIFGSAVGNRISGGPGDDYLEAVGQGDEAVGDAGADQCVGFTVVASCEAQPGDVTHRKILYGFNENWNSGQYSLQAQLNAPVRRVNLGWLLVQPQPGHWDWTAYDRVYEEILAAGLRPLMVVLGAPCWATGISGCTGHGPHAPGPGFLPEWSEFISRVASRYPEAVAIEVWNEPNLDYFFPGADPGRYVTVLKSAYLAVKRVDPAMPVISGGVVGNEGDGVVGPGSVSGDTFIRQMYAHGARGYMDGIGIHPYPFDRGFWSFEAIPRLVERTRWARNTAGDSTTPIWVTEVGVPTAAGPGFPYPLTAIEQAAQLVRYVEYFELQPDVSAVLVHRLSDQPYPDSVESGFGIYGTDGSPKLAACALSLIWQGSLVCPPDALSALGIG